MVVLLVVSVTGPMLGIRAVTLATAFGIAVVKAYLVAKNFMHLDVERRLVVYILVTCLSLMLLFFFAVSPDVMKHIGANWENVGALNMQKMVEQSEPKEEEGGEGEHASEGEHAAEAAPAIEAAPAAEAAPATEAAPAGEAAPAEAGK